MIFFIVYATFHMLEKSRKTRKNEEILLKFYIKTISKKLLFLRAFLVLNFKFCMFKVKKCAFT